MTVYDATRYDDTRPPISPRSAGEEVCQIAHYTNLGSLVANDLVRLMKWPAGTVVSGVEAVCDDMDACATPTLTFSVGMLNDDGDDLDASGILISSSTIGQSGSVATRSHVAGFKYLSQQEDSNNNPTEKTIALKINTAAATAAAGDVAVICRFKAAEFGY